MTYIRPAVSRDLLEKAEFIISMYHEGRALRHKIVTDWLEEARVYLAKRQQDSKQLELWNGDGKQE